MRRSVWVGLLLGVTGCFADPPVVGETTAANSSNGATSDGASTGSTDDTPSTTEPQMTSGVMTSSAEVTGSVEATSIEPPTTGEPATSGSVSIGDTTSAPSETGSTGTCTCGFDAGSMRAPDGAFECVEGGAGFEPAPVDQCPKEFGPSSSCMAFPVTAVGCCDPQGNVLWCPDSMAETGPTLINCAVECGG